MRLDISCYNNKQPLQIYQMILSLYDELQNLYSYQVLCFQSDGMSCLKNQYL